MEDEVLRGKLAKNAIMLREKVLPERINGEWEAYLKKICSENVFPAIWTIYIIRGM